MQKKTYNYGNVYQKNNAHAKKNKEKLSQFFSTKIVKGLHCSYKIYKTYFRLGDFRYLRNN